MRQAKRRRRRGGQTGVTFRRTDHPGAVAPPLLAEEGNTFLQAKAQGLKQEEPKNGRASSFDCVLIRSYLTKLYRDMIREETDRAA